MGNNTDGNISALEQQERKQDEADKRHERFREDVFGEIFDELDELRDRYEEIRKSYGFEDKSDDFDAYVKEMF